MKNAHILISLLLTLLPPVAQAQINVIRVTVLDGGTTSRGTQMAALQFDLEPGWKTYWRSPGDAGIPPSFSWDGSQNIETMAMTWPTPVAFEQSGMRSIGYKDRMVLPLELTPAQDGKDVRLKGAVDLGICKDICVPARLEFDRVLSPDSPRNSAITAALAARPYSAKDARVRAAQCALSPTEDGLKIVARITMPSAGGTEIAVIEPGNPLIWASEAKSSRSGDTLTASAEFIHAEGGTFALDRSKIRLTVLGQSYAVDIRGCDAG